MLIAGMFLRQKTHNQVLGQSAGVPCKVASGLRSHGFEAEAGASGMMKGTKRPCDERHMLSGFKDGDREDGMIARNDASSDSEGAHHCDETIEYDIVNAMCGVSSDVEKANCCGNSCENVENASSKLGTG